MPSSGGFYGAGAQVLPILGGSAFDGNYKSVTPGASGSEGSWTQFVASTSQDWYGFILQVAVPTMASGGGTYSVDVGVGASGSEVLVLENIKVDSHTANPAYLIAFVPVFVPSGSRVAFRASNTGTGATGVIVLAVGSSAPAFSGHGVLGSKMEAIGEVSAAGSSTTQLTAATSKAYLGVSCAQSSSGPGIRAVLEVGASGSEIPYQANILSLYGNGQMARMVVPKMEPLVSGVRLAVTNLDASTATVQAMGVI